jgi:dipeptidyl aminopeptidase/acylaminoacyl peptidase
MTRAAVSRRWSAAAFVPCACLILSCAGGDSARPTRTPAVATAPGGGAVDEPAGQEAPAAGLRLEGTPPIPDALRDRLQQYLNTRNAAVTDVADDGRSMLVTTRFGESKQMHLVKTPGGARHQLTFSREPVQQALFVPGTGGDSLVYVIDVGGNEQYQIVRVDLADRRSTRLTDGKSRNMDPVWTDDGKRLAWASTARNGRDFDIWVSDGVAPKTASLAVEGKGQWLPLSFSRDGNSLLIVERISITHSKLHLADLSKKTVAPLTPGDKPVAHRDAVLSPDGRRAYVTSDRDGEFVSLYELDIAKAAWRPLTAKIPWNVEEIELSGDGRTLAFVTNEADLGRLYLLDTRTRRFREAAGVPEGIPDDLTFARKTATLGFSLGSATLTGDAYTYDLRRGKLARWTESEMGGLDPKRLVEPTLIEYESFDGKKIPAFYYRPAGPGPFPVLLTIHGGPESQARPTFEPLVQYLTAEAGIAILDPNVRGSDGYGKTYLTLDNGMKREDSVKDIGALLDWIGKQKELDAKRVAVIGGSYGGYMVLASLVHFGHRLVAGVEVVGISSFVTFLKNTADYRRDLRRVEYGDERDPAMRKHLEAISPLAHVDRIKTALFVAQGANDPRVPASESQQIVDAVRKSGHDVWYMVAPDEGHGFKKKENADTFDLLSILFLEKHLGVKRPAASADR